MWRLTSAISPSATIKEARTGGKNSLTTKKDNDSNMHTLTGSAVTAMSSNKTRGNVLLQTATAIAPKVRILFDSESQRSYVTDSPQSKRGLNTTSSETLHLNTFGEKFYRKQKCQVVSFQLRTGNNKCDLS